MSPTYPGRPIKPLPKRRLRERLSPEAVETIKYPPAPSTTTPLFYYPYSTGGEEDLRGGVYPVDRQKSEEIERNYISRRNGGEVDSEDEYHESPYRGRYSRHSPDISGRSYRYVQKPEPKYSKPEPPASTTSSADGYDSFENTNNKKKRKIPTPGDAGLNGIHLSNELASLGISSSIDETLSQADPLVNIPKYHSPGGSSGISGISGPGRGRYGRVRNGRSPLRTLSDGSGTWSNGRPGKPQQPQFTPTKPTGIISNAIANAEKTPATPIRGQENVSLLQQKASQKSSPASAQFTFTCDSQVPGTVTWPGSTSGDNGRGMNTQATQTSPKLPSRQPRQGAAPDSYPPESDPNAKPRGPSKKSRRRAAEKELLIAARQRREQQEYQNFHHPPAPEEEWICEFCEYERIFGTPPTALIRQYEIKDRRQRKQEAERRRLLEKAKMKGRKGKKGSKVSAQKAQSMVEKQAQFQADLGIGKPLPGNGVGGSASQRTQSEEYYDEGEYEEDYVGDDDPPIPDVPPLRTDSLGAGQQKMRPPGTDQQLHGGAVVI